MFSLSTSSFSRAETPMPDSSSEVLLESHPHVKLVVTLLLWSGISWRCFLCMASTGSGVLNTCINCTTARLPDSRFGARQLPACGSSPQQPDPRTLATFHSCSARRALLPAFHRGLRGPAACWEL